MNPVPSGEWADSFDSPVAHVRAEPTAPESPKEPARLSIVLPFIEREIPRVLRLLDWMSKLSGQLNRTIYLLPFKGIEATKVRAGAALAFSEVQEIKDNEGVSTDWQNDEKVRDAAGPNSLFRQAAWYFYFNPALGPWLYLEPDCVVLTKSWDDEIEAAYRTSGKPFFGAGMKSQNGDEYLNGAAVYPQNAVALAPGIVTRTTWKEFPEMEIAFDVAGGRDVFRKAHVTDLIQLGYRSDELPEIAKRVVLFHGDRGGLLLESKLAGSSTGSRAGGQQGSSRTTTIRKAEGSTTFPSTSLENDNRNGTSAIQPTIGDEFRYHVNRLANLATNTNRRVRILRALRQAKLVPRGR